jgi:hypothetical protein
MIRFGLVASLAALIGLAACTTTHSGVPDPDTVDEIREELERTSCRNRMDDLAFRLRGLLLADTTGSADPRELGALLDDSLLVCPSSEQSYLIEKRGDSWVVRCPVGHGSKSFEAP